MAEAWRYPKVRDGEVIGLLGGSFDPPHMGHVNVTLSALKQFRLDRVWWLVSPGNPLKAHGPAPMAERIAAARALVDHPRITVTGVEALLGTHYTAQTLAALQRRYRGAHFVWLMGADNLGQFHLWQDWRQIMQTVPVGVLARPGQRISARLSPAARIYAGARLWGWQAELLGRARPPAWCFVNLPMSDLSSSAIRRARDTSAGTSR